MASEQIPVTPTLIKWARARAGISVHEAAQMFKKIEQWEAGESFPTYAQLEQLADKFKVPIAVFFFPEPPDVPPIRELFRTLPAATFAQIPPRVQYLLRKAKALQLNLFELYQGRNPARRLITRDLRFPVGINIDAMVREVRDYLGVSLGDQISWNTDDEALKRWRRTLFDVGIFVFKDAFRAPEYSGFCLYDDVFPIIYANNSVAKTRQIFTLIHELGHLLFHTSGIDKLRDDYIADLPVRFRRIEVLCNRFAAQFLVPEAEFATAFRGLPATEATAARLASHFHVSREVIFRKLLDRGLISEEVYSNAANRWAQQAEREPGGNPYWTKIAYLGREYIERALAQYRQNRINQAQLAEYLDWKPRYVETLEEYFARGGE